MYKVSDIRLRGQDKKIRCECISDLSLKHVMTCEDENGNKVDVSFTPYGFEDKEGLLKYLRENFGINEIMGINDGYVMALSNMEIELLDCLDWNEYIDSYSTNKRSYIYSVDDEDHLLFNINYRLLPVSWILLNQPDEYDVNGNLLVVHVCDSDKFSSYTIADVDKFNSLVKNAVENEKFFI